MKVKLTSTVLLLCFLASGGAGQDIQLGEHLQHFTSVRHPAGVEVGAREAARNYIKDKFREYGLEVASHSFNTSMIVGENVIGVAEGSEKGPLLLVGADYDTSLQSNPLEDNGAGVAAMLEVARNYMEETEPWGHFTRNRTVIFVAFDLNTKEYRKDSSAGRPGSYHFVHQWLWPHLNQSLLGFGGAFILDSITRFSMEPRTQYLPDGFSETFPEAYKRISEDDMKGNFMALVSRGTSQNRHLAKTFVDNYMKHRKAGLVRVQEMVLENAAHVTSGILDMINHQAHFHFWAFKPSDRPTALPAVLLTDTDIYRPSSEPCLPPCTSEAFLTRRRKQAISLTCESLIHTLFELQAERRPGIIASGASSLGSVTATWLMIVMAALLY